MMSRMPDSAIQCVDTDGDEERKRPVLDFVMSTQVSDPTMKKTAAVELGLCACRNGIEP